MKITLVLLTLNEYESLRIIFPELYEKKTGNVFDAVCAIDGGSTDGTLQYYYDNNVSVVGQSQKGRGAAFQLALEKVDTDAYIFFSPDGNEDTDDLPKFKYYLERGADLVIASRMMVGAKNEEDDSLLKPRKWVNNIFNFLINIIFNQSEKYITDSINGYRAITKDALQKLSLNSIDYTIEFQMTIRALKEQLKIVEFPTYEFQRISGKTKAPSFKTGVQFIFCLLKEIFFTGNNKLVP